MAWSILDFTGIFIVEPVSATRQLSVDLNKLRGAETLGSQKLLYNIIISQYEHPSLIMSSNRKGFLLGTWLNSIYFPLLSL